MNSDPFGMMFDAWADPEAYAKRMQDMTKGFGTVDRETGETKFNINESMQMAQIAKLQGRSVEEVRREVMDRNKRDFIKNNLTDEQKRTLSEDEKDYLGTVAKYNAKEKRYEAKVYDEEQQRYIAKDVNELTSEDLKNVMPEDHDERMETWVSDIASVVKKMDAEKIWESADVASSTYQNTLNSFNERLTAMHESYLNTRQETIDNIKSTQDLIETSVNGYLEQYANNVKSDTDSVHQQMEKIKGSANDIAGALMGVAQTVNTAKSAVDQQISRMMSAQEGNFNTASAKVSNTVSSNSSGKTVTVKQQQQPAQAEKKQTASREVATGSYSGTSSANSWAESVAMMKDGVASGGGKDMAIIASKVTPINDGVMTAKPSKNDEILAAEKGGVIDNMVNGTRRDSRRILETLERIASPNGALPQDDALAKM